uniref:Uncharacterized protein n=1 Tax=Calcidiscus leptoporus TaxID=127549 RepID=A0A7S0JM15_9EUKA
MFSLASRLGARLLFAEHRYYGRSLPFGAASFTPTNLSLLSIEQALADYAALLVALPNELGCHSARRSGSGRTLCDVVLFGGSYGGMLAAWHRVRFPQLTLGAVASGAPVDFYPGEGIQRAFAAAVNATYATYGRAGCASMLGAALASAETATEGQLAMAGVRPCAPMGADAPSRYAFYARGAIASLAMLDYPYATEFVGVLPANPVQRACVDLMAGTGGLLPKLHAAVLHFVNATGTLRCIDLQAELVGVDRHLRPRRGVDYREVAGDLGVRSWNYQACTELPLEPITSDGLGFYPEQSGKQLAELETNCAKRFSVRPRPGWMGLAFGLGADYRHHSNILFIENEKDPWHVGTASVPAVTGIGGTVRRHLARGGAHHQDLRFASPLDAQGVLEARRLVESTVRGWLQGGGES